MATFTYTPDFGGNAEYQPRVSTARFGDGYEQRTPLGLNPMVMSWDLRFVARGDAESSAILAFLEARAGAEAFDWVPPTESVAIRAVCRKWSRTFDRHQQSTIAAKFERVNEP